MPTKPRLVAGPAPERRRQRFLSLLEIVGFAVLVSGALVLLFPESRIVPRRASEPPVSREYAADARGRVPGSPDSRTQLVIGPREDLTTALAKVRRYLMDPEEGVRRQARLLELEILRRQAYARTAGTPERTERLRDLTDRLQRVAAMPLTAPQYEYLAELAQELGQVSLYVEICRKLAALRPTAAPLWLEKGTRALLGQGDYRGAAEMYFDAQGRAQTLDERREYFLRALRALQSGNLLDEALEAADRHLAGLDHDRTALIFLIKLALAADRPDVAARFARQLMRLSLRRWNALAYAAYHRGAPGTLFATAPLAGTAWSGWPAVARLMRTAAQSIPAFDEEAYELAYRVFLANGDVNDAYRVAQAAVGRVPNNLVWRERFAQTAEWSEEPEVALRQWYFIAERRRSPASWSEVARLALGLGDGATLIRAYQELSRLRALTDTEWERFVHTFETEGRPEEALAELERANRANPRRFLAANIAALSARLGRVDQALAAYCAIRRRYGVTPEFAVEEAGLWLRKGNVRAAFDALAKAKSRADRGASSFWELYGALAWQLQLRKEARAAFEGLAERGQLRSAGLERLALLYRTEDRGKAMRLAESGWRKYREPWFLLSLIEMLQQEKAWGRLKATYESLTPSDLVRFEKIPYFWTWRAEFRAHAGDTQGALQDYRRALSADPESIETRAAILWLLIDAGDTEGLRRYLHEWRTVSGREPKLWGAYAAGYYTLGAVGRALPYFARQAVRKDRDYLWLLNYADALEQAGYGARAWGLRRHVWRDLRRSVKNYPPARLPWGTLEAAARLALMRSPGDDRLRVVQAMLRRRAIEKPGNELEAATINELILAWTLSTEQLESARVWLWLNYGRQLARPGWAELSLALSRDDMAMMESLILDQRQTLPAHDRIEAKRRTDHLAWAREDAFRSLATNEKDDAMHELFADSALDLAGYGRFRVGRESRGVVERSEKRAQVGLQLTPRFSLEPAYTRIDQRSEDQAQVINIPDEDTEIAMTGRFRWHRSGLALSAFRREALSGVMGFRLDYRRELQGGVSSLLRATRNETAEDTVLLLVAGVKDELALQMQYDPAKREYLRGRLAWQRFYSQERDRLGRGVGLTWEAGHRVRIEYPDVIARIYGTFQRYDGSAAQLPQALRQVLPGGVGDISFFVPNDFDVYGIGLSFGDSVRGLYSRAWRPYADIGMLYNTETGRGYDLSAGISGPGGGGDRLTFYYGLSRGGTGADDLIRRFGLQYQIFFNRGS